MTITGRKPKPVEQKRALGNPGHRALPDANTIAVLPRTTEVPTPTRPLGNYGRAVWDRVWFDGRAWLAASDLELVMLVCEQVDERSALRLLVLREGHWRDRSGLRALDDQIARNLAALAFCPTERSRLGLAEVKTVSKLEELRRQRS